MLPRWIPLSGLLFLCFSVDGFGQESPNRFETLKRALGLSDSELAELHERRPTASVDGRTHDEVDHIRNHMLDDSRKMKLAALEKTLYRDDAATLAIGLGFIREEQWPGGSSGLCLFYPITTYASNSYALELGITPIQVEQFVRIQTDTNRPLWDQVREKGMQRSALLKTGIGEDSPAVVQLGTDIDQLQAELNARPRRDLALAVLNSIQRAKLEAFETELGLASQAIELGLMRAPVRGEVLCL